jgi:uncharacterized membrane protein
MSMESLSQSGPAPTGNQRRDTPVAEQAGEVAATLVGEHAEQVARSTNAVNALIHLYRAEMGRMTAYRARLDTTTNWAITTSGLVGTFAFGNNNVSHAALLFAMLLNLFFLVVEARRFRHYEASRSRVLLLEQNFYPEVLERPVPDSWTDQLVASLILAWITKIELAGEPSFDIGHLFARASIGTIPGELIWVVVAGFYAWLVFIAFSASQRYAAGEEW